MIEAFKPGTRVRFVLSPGMGGGLGGRAKISDKIPTGKWDWKIPGYWGEGFYLVESVPEQRKMLVNEDDLVLDVNLGTSEPNHCRWGTRHLFRQGICISHVAVGGVLDHEDGKFEVYLAGNPKSTHIGTAPTMDRAKVTALRFFTKYPELVIKDHDEMDWKKFWSTKKSLQGQEEE